MLLTPVTRLSILLVLTFGSSVPATMARSTANLHTADTLVRLHAGKLEPRVLTVQSPASSPWRNEDPEHLIASAIIAGHTVPLHWTLDPRSTRATPSEVAFVYVSQTPRLQLTWQWTAPASFGPLRHQILIKNLDAQELWIPLQPSFQFRFSVSATQPLEHISVDKGAGKPTAVGTHVDSLTPGVRWQGTSSTYAVDEGPREVIPWMLVQRSATAARAGGGWYTGIEFSGRSSLSIARDRTSIFGTTGLNANPGPFMTRLAPGGTFETPSIFLGAFHGDAEDAGNMLRPWVRQVLGNPETWKNPAYPVLVNNSWGSGMQVDEPLALRMIQDSAELGMEMFHLDAGWFRGVGDWYPDPKKFPHGLATIAQAAHARGLKFGIWVDWAQAGVDPNPGAANVHDPNMRDWLIADAPAGWKPDEFVGRTMDLGSPAVQQYAQSELERMVSSYKLDMLEHDGYVVAHACSRGDHPHAPPPAGYPGVVEGNGIKLPLATNSTDVSYHAARAYYDVYTHLRASHPDLLLEICNDGGRMVDFGSAAHGDYFSITDSYDPVSNRQAFYDASHVLPPAMLEDYVQRWPTPTLANFRYMLRSGMMGWLTIMQDTNAWSPEEHAAAKHDFAVYKEKLRPLIRSADLFHISPRPDGVHWDALEYFDPKRGTGVVYAFRGTIANEPSRTFSVRGLRPDRSYRLHFEDGSSSDASVRGRDLLRDGITVTLPAPQSSELIFLEETGG